MPVGKTADRDLLQDNLRAAPHGAGRHGVSNDIVTVDIHFAAHMPFDEATDDHNSSSAIVQRVKPLSLDKDMP